MKWNICSKLLSISVILLVLSCNQSSNKCIIKGKTIGTNDSSVILLRAGEDYRYDGIEVPIINSTFKYELNINQPEGYYLIYKSFRQNGEGKLITFIAEKGRINLTLYPENEYDRNVISGGELNKEYKQFKQEVISIFDPISKSLRDSISVLIKTDRYYSDTIKSLLIKRQIAKGDDHNKIMQLINDLRNKGEDLSEQTKTLKSKIDKVARDRTNYKQDYIGRNLSVVSFFVLYQDLINSAQQIDLEMAESNYKKLAEKYPGHPYISLIGNIIEGRKNVRIGGRFIDFSAPDLNGQMIKLCDIIEGKVALLDLWSSWCGSCIAYSRTMVPVYNEFKSYDFIIVGVSADKNATRLFTLNKRENYPWINLIEINNQNKIWEKYNLINAGGKAFLIDKNGIIIAIQPTANELRNILSKEIQ